MKSQPLWLSAFAVCGAMFMSVGSGCKDDGEVNNEPPLPGVGPIGLGGSSSTGGAGGTAGTAGTAGMAGTGGAGAGGTGGAGAGGAGAGGAGAGGAGAGGSTGGSGGGMAVCPTFGGDAKLRFGNLVPAASTLDFCIKGPGKADFEGPVFKCAAGSPLQYKQLTKAFQVGAGAYEVRSVTGADCSGTHATASVTVGANDLFTVLAFGGGATGETAKVASFKNDGPRTDGSVNLRFINGIHKGFPLDVGLSADAKLPTTVAPAVFVNVPFAGIAAKADPGPLFPIDEQGYALGASVLDTPVGAAKTGDPTAIFAAFVSIGPANAAVTAFGAGILGDTTFPPLALVCQDGKDDGNLDSCVQPLAPGALHTPECRDRNLAPAGFDLAPPAFLRLLRSSGHQPTPPSRPCLTRARSRVSSAPPTSGKASLWSPQLSNRAASAGVSSRPTASGASVPAVGSPPPCSRFTPRATTSPPRTRRRKAYPWRIIRPPRSATGSASRAPSATAPSRAPSARR